MNKQAIKSVWSGQVIKCTWDDFKLKNEILMQFDLYHKWNNLNPELWKMLDLPDSCQKRHEFTNLTHVLKGFT